MKCEDGSPYCDRPASTLNPKTFGDMAGRLPLETNELSKFVEKPLPASAPWSNEEPCSAADNCNPVGTGEKRCCPYRLSAKAWVEPVVSEGGIPTGKDQMTDASICEKNWNSIVMSFEEKAPSMMEAAWKSPWDRNPDGLVYRNHTDFDMNMGRQECLSSPICRSMSHTACKKNPRCRIGFGARDLKVPGVAEIVEMYAKKMLKASPLGKFLPEIEKAATDEELGESLTKALSKLENENKMALEARQYAVEKAKPGPSKAERRKAERRKLKAQEIAIKKKRCKAIAMEKRKLRKWLQSEAARKAQRKEDIALEDKELRQKEVQREAMEVKNKQDDANEAAKKQADEILAAKNRDRLKAQKFQESRQKKEEAEFDAAMARKRMLQNWPPRCPGWKAKMRRRRTMFSLIAQCPKVGKSKSLVKTLMLGESSDLLLDQGKFSVYNSEKDSCAATCQKMKDPENPQKEIDYC